MMQNTYWEDILWRIQSFFLHWRLRLTCPHPKIMMLTTMDSIRGWERISGAAECTSCHMSFHAFLCKDETEQEALASHN